MPQASITINAVPGSDADLPINTLVQLDNQNIGGELTYLWEILDQPPGTLDVLSSAVAQNPTFTPKKEGTYLLKLTVNATLVTEQTQTVVAAVVQLKTLERIPAAGEVLEADTADGWATAMGALLRRIDALLSDPGVMVGVNASGGVIVKGDVVRCTANSTIKAGLPGQEVVPGFTKALATTLGQVDELLCVTEGTPSGGSSVAIGALMKVRYIGRFTSVVGGPPAVGDPVYVSDTGTLVLTPGTVSRQVGSAINAANPFDVWFTGVGAQDVTVTPIDRRYVVHGPLGTLPNGVRVDGTNATGLTSSFRVRAGNLTTVPFQVQGVAAQVLDLQQWLNDAGTVLAHITAGGQLVLDVGQLTLTAEGILISATSKHLTFGGSGQRVVWSAGSYIEGTSIALDFNVSGGSSAQALRVAGVRTEFNVLHESAHLFQLRVTPTEQEVINWMTTPLYFRTDGTRRWQITATGVLASVGGPRAIQSVLDPVTAQDAATKNSSETFATTYANTLYTPVNHVINGAFEFWQRGTSFLSLGTTWQYIADRWAQYSTTVSGLVNTGQDPSDHPDQFRFSHYVQRVPGNTNTDLRALAQEIDRESVRQLRGKRVRFTFWAKAGANFSAASSIFSVAVNSGNGAETEHTNGPYTGALFLIVNGITLTTSWTRYSFASAGTVATDRTTLAVLFGYNPVGTAGADDSFKVAGVMLTEDLGVEPPPNYIHAGGSMAGELEACQRYFEKSYNIAINPGASSAAGEWLGNVAGPGGLNPAVKFLTRKRSTPFSIGMWGTGGTASVWDAVTPGGVFSTNAVTAAQISEVGFEPVATGYTSADVDKLVWGQWTADSEI